MRLEHGLGGFPRVPHWLPAARRAANKAKAWVSAEAPAIERALAGDPPPDVPEMTKALETKLAKKRDKTWL